MPWDFFEFPEFPWPESLKREHPGEFCPPGDAVQRYVEVSLHTHCNDKSKPTLVSTQATGVPAMYLPPSQSAATNPAIPCSCTRGDLTC